jgi:phage terminase Nu1 subunit (DNA packaging protein)
MSMSRARLTKAQAAEKLGVSPKSIERHAAAGMPYTGTGAKRRYPWPEIRAWRDKLLIAQGRAQAEAKLERRPPVSLDEARLRKETAEAQLKEIALAEAEGKLIPVTMHEQRYAAACDRLRSALMAIPSKYLGRIQQTRTDAEAHSVGEAIRDETLRALSGLSHDSDDEATRGNDGTAAA